MANSFTITAGYGDTVGLGDTIQMSWEITSMEARSYELEWNIGESGWQPWRTQTGTVSTASVILTSTDFSVTGSGKKVQFRVRALNGSHRSDWVESNILTISGGMDIKTGDAWKEGSVWIKSGGSWVRAKRVWIKTGGAWVIGK